MANPTRLLDRVGAAMRTAQHSLRTEAADLGWVRRFIRFTDQRPPARMGAGEVAAFPADPAAPT